MIVACPTCHSQYDVTGRPVGTRARCRCGTVFALEPLPPEAGMLACPRCQAGVPATAHACAYCAVPLLVRACPRCLARIFDGHAHCPHCGTSTTARAEPMTTEAEAHARACPLCEIPLATRMISDIAVDECDRCGGMFLDRSAIERVIGDRRQARAEALVGAYRDTGATAAPRPPHKTYLKCPTCAEPMNRRQFARGAKVVLDVCRQHGTWFERGELPRVVEFVMKGGLESAAKAEAADLRDQARRDRQDAASAALQLERTGTATNGASLIDLLFSIWR